MFYECYELTALPFQEPVTADRILTDERFAQGLSRLEYFVIDGAAALVTGPTGVGKSSLLQIFTHNLPVNRYHPLHLYLTNMQSISLLRMIVSEMGERPRRGKDVLFAQILEKARSSERTTVLIVDEAHLLTEETLIDLRLLISAPMQQATKLKLLLAGQEDLRRILTRKTLADLRGRITVRYQLKALTRDQTDCYIDHRLQAVGGSNKIFEDEAKTQIYEYTGGVPRLINNLATICLIHGSEKKQKRITAPLVHDAAGEMRAL